MSQAPVVLVLKRSEESIMRGVTDLTQRSSNRFLKTPFVEDLPRQLVAGDISTLFGSLEAEDRPFMTSFSVHLSSIEGRWNLPKLAAMRFRLSYGCSGSTSSTLPMMGYPLGVGIVSDMMDVPDDVVL